MFQTTTHFAGGKVCKAYHACVEPIIGHCTHYVCARRASIVLPDPRALVITCDVAWDRLHDIAVQHSLWALPIDR